MKSYYLLSHLEKTHNVHLVTFHHGGPPTQEQRDAIARIGVHLTAIPLHPITAGAACVRSAVTDLPLEIAFYTRPDFQAAVDRILAEHTVDLAISFFMRTAEYVRAKPGLRRILIAEDCRLEYQTRSVASSTSALQRLVRKWEVAKLSRYEPAVMSDFDCTTFVSQQDVDAMRRQRDDLPYALVTNGVRTDEFQYVDEQEQRSGILFAGKLDVLANILAARWIVDDILPMVRAAVPEAFLSIVGAHPTHEVQRMAASAADQNVRLEANVPNMVPYLHGHAVFLHPHRGGSGIQNKVLEAMSAGCVVVTTPSGIQGIDAVHGEHCLIGTTSEELARHVTWLLQHPQERSAMGQAARQLMEETHTWQHVYDQIDHVIDRVLAPGEHHGRLRV